MEAMHMSRQLATGCKAMIVVGTSAEVAPANQMPMIAKRSGATIIEMNLEPTQLTSWVTDIFIEGKASITLPALLEAIGI